MFEIKWAEEKSWKEQAPLTAPQASRLKRSAVDKSLYLVWEEHCVECAVPSCYTTCALYKKRADGLCARLVYGVYPNKGFSGHFDFGADLRFRKWGKFEAAIRNTSLPIGILPHAMEEGFAALPGRAQNLASRVLAPLLGSRLDFDDFVLECFSPQTEPFRLVIEHYQMLEHGVRKTLYRNSFEIRAGMNYHTVPFESFKITDERSFVLLYPESDAPEKRLVFTWLDFIKYKVGRRPAPERAASKPSAPILPSAKVKCVAWDLDNTFWSGILAETSDLTALRPRSGVLELIRALDERGIVQTVISKNNHDDAWPVLERLQVQDYFIYPAINWGQKSENLKKVAEKINIGLDTFAFIDDSPFERSEVSSALPQIRVFAETEIDRILGRPEFDVPITEASRTRRLSYLTEMKRETIQASFMGSYEEFLASCQMKMKVFGPSQDQALRCWELIQRTNQLNLSGRRYELEEFKRLLSQPDWLGLAIECADKFGDYGIVGFASISTGGPQPALVDFVLSCRVAQKRVEHAFFEWLAQNLRARGHHELLLNLVLTARNKPLQQVFADLPFETLGNAEATVQMRLDLAAPIDTHGIVSVQAELSR